MSSQNNLVVLVNSILKRNQALVDALQSHQINYIEEPLDYGEFIIVTGDTSYIFLRTFVSDFFEGFDISSRIGKIAPRTGLIILLIQSSKEPSQSRFDFLDAQNKERLTVYYRGISEVLKQGVLPIAVGSSVDTADFIITFIKRIQNNTVIVPELRKGMKENWAISRKRLYLFEAFGTEIAHQMQTRYKTLENLFKSLPNRDLALLDFSTLTVSGKELGLRNAKKIVDVLYSEKPLPISTQDFRPKEPKA